MTQQPWGAPQPAQPGPSTRPFYKKKRYVLPAVALLGVVALSDPETGEKATAKPEASQVQSLVGTAVAQEGLSDEASATIQQVQAEVAQKQAAEKAAAAAAAAAKVEAAKQAAAVKAAAVKAAADKAAADRAAAAQRAAEQQEAEQSEAAESVYYENCDAVRAAGAAPIRRGQPGYGRHLDRDGDGQGCGAD